MGACRACRSTPPTTAGPTPTSALGVQRRSSGRSSHRRRRRRSRPARAARRSARVRRPHRARVLRGVVALRRRRTGKPHSMKNLALGARLQPRRGAGGARRRARQAAAAAHHAWQSGAERQRLPGVAQHVERRVPARALVVRPSPATAAALAPSGPRMHGRLAHTSSATRTDTGMMEPCSRPMQRMRPLDREADAVAR